MPVQGMGCAAAPALGAHIPGLLSSLVLPHPWIPRAPDRLADSGRPALFAVEPHLLYRHHRARLADPRLVCRQSGSRGLAVVRLARQVAAHASLSTAECAARVAARRDRRAARRRRRADPVPRRHERRRQPRAAVQERPVRRRGQMRRYRTAGRRCSRFRSPIRGSTASRSAACSGPFSPGTARSIWRRICGAWSGLGTVEVVVEFHPPTFLADCGSRKALARYCHARIAGGVAAAHCRATAAGAGPAGGRARRRRGRGGAVEAIAAMMSAGFSESAMRDVTKRVFIKTYGCQMNVYDSARMAELLAPLGFARARDSRGCRSGDPEHLPHPRKGGRKGVFRARPAAAPEGAPGAAGRPRC